MPSLCEGKHATRALGCPANPTHFLPVFLNTRQYYYSDSHLILRAAFTQPNYNPRNDARFSESLRGKECFTRRTLILKPGDVLYFTQDFVHAG
jgi:hypothetical protein